MKDVTVTGLISKIMNRYVITSDDGTQYELSAIHPWEAVSPDFGSGIFADTQPVSRSATRPTKAKGPSRKQ
jgi:hypothetical protein